MLSPRGHLEQLFFHQSWQGLHQGKSEEEAHPQPFKPRHPHAPAQFLEEILFKSRFYPGYPSPAHRVGVATFLGDGVGNHGDGDVGYAGIAKLGKTQGF